MVHSAEAEDELGSRGQLACWDKAVMVKWAFKSIKKCFLVLENESG